MSKYEPNVKRDERKTCFKFAVHGTLFAIALMTGDANSTHKYKQTRFRFVLFFLSWWHICAITKKNNIQLRH